jgi:AcrR family transcriptional regulator
VSETRSRIITATNELFRRQGFNGTSLKEITAAAEATTGSLYHFWPGGKEELTAEVLVTSGAVYCQLFEAIVTDTANPGQAIADFFEGGATVLESTDFIDPCPIGTVAREVASTNERLRSVANDVFASWIDAATSFFVRSGFATAQAQELAATLVAAIEGGFVLARATRNADPFRASGRQFQLLIEATLAALTTQPN